MLFFFLVRTADWPQFKVSDKALISEVEIWKSKPEKE